VGSDQSLRVVRVNNEKAASIAQLTLLILELVSKIRCVSLGGNRSEIGKIRRAKILVVALLRLRFLPVLSCEDRSGLPPKSYDVFLKPALVLSIMNVTELTPI
jgi:hypothetical protein